MEEIGGYVPEAFAVALTMAGAAGSECEICGEKITTEDLETAVCGVNGGLVHKSCWGDRGILSAPGKPEVKPPFPGASK